MIHKKIYSAISVHEEGKQRGAVMTRKKVLPQARKIR